MSYVGGWTQRKARIMPRRTNTELEARINKALELPLVSDWERNFLSSILDAAKRYGKLTGKQESVLQRVESNNNPDLHLTCHCL